MDRLTRKIGSIIEFADGKGYANLSLLESQQLLFGRLAAYEDNGFSPEEITHMQAENDKIKKGFVLACRCLADNLDCPASDGDTNFPECNGEMDKCGDADVWECWQKYFTKIVETEAVCRVCGCTWNNACPGGCSWVEDDLCSACTMKWLEWKSEMVEWGKIFCPMINEEVMTYYRKGTAPYDTVTAPFVDEDGDVCYFNYDHDEGGWNDEVLVVCSKEEWDNRVKLSCLNVNAFLAVGDYGIITKADYLRDMLNYKDMEVRYEGELVVVDIVV